MKKYGEMDLSFGVIFSIILIIAFLGFGFYAIVKFVELQESVQIEKFLGDFQNDVNNLWKSSQGSQEVEYVLPKKIISVCFSDDEFQNLIFTADNIIPGEKIENIDIDKITKSEDPYCILNNGKISLTISKAFGETLVSVSR